VKWLIVSSLQSFKPTIRLQASNFTQIFGVVNTLSKSLLF